MVAFKTILANIDRDLLQLAQQRRADGVLPGRGAFVATYNTLLMTKRPFAYDEAHDKFLYDGGEMTGRTLAELRLLCARESRQAPALKTVQQAAQALCSAHKVNSAAGLPLQAAMTALLNESSGDQDLVRTITVHGVPFQFVAMRDIKLAVDAHGAKGAKRIRAVMRALGWRARPAIIYGRRMRGFILPAGADETGVTPRRGY
jgi:hypothetical protein